MHYVIVFKSKLREGVAERSSQYDAATKAWTKKP